MLQVGIFNGYFPFTLPEQVRRIKAIALGLAVGLLTADAGGAPASDLFKSHQYGANRHTLCGHG